MNVIGIIAEYNPFHLGHAYQIKKIKEMYPEPIVVAIISTSFTQRGDISIINKWDKTKICLEEGIDLIIELPTLYVTQSADIFAYGALAILNQFKIDTLVFGSETNDVELLKKMAITQLHNDDYDKSVKKYLSLGYNYPTAMSKALFEIEKIEINKPNDLLAVSYIKQIIKNNYPITPISIKRINDYHENNISNIKNNMANASLIRKMLLDNKDVTKYIPLSTKKYLFTIPKINDAYKYLKYNIINNIDTMSSFLDIEEGIEKRIIKNINKCNSWEELIMNIKTKRYTYNKINRMLLHILLNIKKEDNNKEFYLRLLGFNSRGKSYLNSIKKSLNMELLTGYKQNKSTILDIEFRATYIYSLIVNDPSLIEKEYKNKPIIM